MSEREGAAAGLQGGGGEWVRWCLRQCVAVGQRRTPPSTDLEELPACRQRWGSP